MSSSSPSVLPTVGVVIASRDRPDDLRHALTAVADAGADVVLVADSASTLGADGRSHTQQVAADAGARCVRLDRPGASVARNAGWQALATDVIAFTDDDCRPRPGWAAHLAAAFADPRVGFVTGGVVGPDGGTAADIDHAAARWVWPADPAHTGSGANLAFRRAALVEVGGYDERLGPGAPGPYGEEHDLMVRILHAGWEGRHLPNVVVEHHDQRDFWATTKLFWIYGMGAGAVCARAAELDPRFGRRLLRRRLWDDGARLALANLLRRWEVPALRAAVTAVGSIVGWRRTRGEPLWGPERLAASGGTTTSVT